MLLSVAGTSGSGKTYSSLLLAAGLAGPNGRVGFLDTENGRGSMYADSPGIMAALPGGFEIARLDPPFTPASYIAAIEGAEKAGINVLVIDSATHEWEGLGGCCDIAENNKLRGMPNWSKAKLEHKKFMNRLLSTDMHLIFCLRARDKVKIMDVDKNGKKSTEVVPIGVQPIAEKSFVFEMLLSLQLDEKSHFAMPIKVPEPLAALFTGKRLLTKDDGARIRQWNETGSAADPLELIRKRARTEAEAGTKAYAAYFSALTPAQRKALSECGDHAPNKAIAEKADQAANGESAREQLEAEALRLGPKYMDVIGSNGFEDVDDVIARATSQQLETILSEMHDLRSPQDAAA